MPPVKHFVAIDIGSNAVRMSLANVKRSQLIIVNSWRKFLSLGDDVFYSGKISETSLNLLQKTLSSFIENSQNYQNPEFTVVATSAMRDAKNNVDVLEYIYKHLGISINILSGDQEAEITRQVIQHCLSWKNKLVILGDLGGGSLEVSIMQGQQLSFKNSFDYGVLRFSKLDLDSQKQYLESFKIEFESIIKHYKNTSQLILTGGTAKVLARLIKKYYLSNNSLESTIEIPWDLFLEVKESILGKNPKEYIKSGDLSEDQANALFSSLLVFEVLGSPIQCQKIIFPLIGLKEGVLLQHARKSFPKRHLRLVL